MAIASNVPMVKQRMGSILGAANRSFGRGSLANALCVVKANASASTATELVRRASHRGAIQWGAVDEWQEHRLLESPKRQNPNSAAALFPAESFGLPARHRHRCDRWTDQYQLLATRRAARRCRRADLRH